MEEGKQQEAPKKEGLGGLRRREEGRAGYRRDAVEATGQEAAPGTHKKTQSWREVRNPQVEQNREGVPVPRESNPHPYTTRAPLFLLSVTEVLF